MTNEHTSLEKYTSHTLFEWVAKGLRTVWRVRGELETEHTAIYQPQIPLSLAALISHSADCSTGGPEGPSPLQLELQLQLTPNNSNCLWHQVI